MNISKALPNTTFREFRPSVKQFLFADDVTKFMFYLAIATAVPLHVCHIILIIIKRNLHENVYFILINLSISDVIIVLLVGLKKVLTQQPVSALHCCFSTSSIIFTFAINLDRYAKVEYGVRYHQLALKKRLVIVIMSIWLFSVIITGMAPAFFLETSARIILVRGFLILCGCALVLSSLWVRHIRNVHLETITRRNRYFGVHGEEFHLLKNLKNTIIEVVQLSFITAILIISANGLHILNFYVSFQRLKIARVVVNALYFFSNPWVYLFVMVDLRKHYFDFFRLYFNTTVALFQRWSQVHPQN